MKVIISCLCSGFDRTQVLEYILSSVLVVCVLTVCFLVITQEIRFRDIEQETKKNRIRTKENEWDRRRRK